MSDVLECVNCGARTFYRKERCPECGCDRFAEREPGVGELVSTTRVHVTPPGVREPNALGLVRFRDGGNVIVQLEDELEVGDTVRLVNGYALRENGDERVTGPRAVRAEE